MRQLKRRLSLRRGETRTKGNTSLAPQPKPPAKSIELTEGMSVIFLPTLDDDVITNECLVIGVLIKAFTF